VIARAAALAALVLLVVTLCPAALANVGDPAPPVQPKAWIGQPLDWKRSRGRVLVLAFVTPKDKESEMILRDMDQVLADHEKKGLEVILVATKPKAEVDLWARTVVRGRTFRIALDGDGRVTSDYFAQTDPFVVVVDRDFRIRFQEDPSMARLALLKCIDTYVAKPPQLTRAACSPRLKPVWDAAEAKQWGTAIKEATAIRDDKKSTSEDGGCAQAFLMMMEIEARKLIESAEKWKREEEWAEALACYDEAASQFSTLPLGLEAKDAAAEIRADKKLKRELEAGEGLREARRLEKEGKREEAISKYSTVGAKFSGTRAGDRAKKRAKELKGG
jgi:hypothetical protein